MKRHSRMRAVLLFQPVFWIRQVNYENINDIKLLGKLESSLAIELIFPI